MWSFHSVFIVLCILLVQIIILPNQASAEFIYRDFHQTLGLVFNGDATTADCNKSKHYIPSNHTKITDENETSLFQHGETGGMFAKTITTTANTTNESDKLKSNFRFGHRDTFQKSSENGCSTRLRITSSYPSQVGSIWYEKRLPVLKGFSTTFTFQVTDHSKVCSYHLDPSFSIQRHQSCSVHGGDGFAFVIHSDPNTTKAIGKDGQNLGYGGMRNALAIEFDMWTNVGGIHDDDFFEDHISIHSNGRNLLNSTDETSSLGYARVSNLADGYVHVVKICYLPYLEKKFFSAMTANKNLIQYLKDNGEGRRLGTLVVYIDEGLQKDEPILAIPLNLSILLELTQSLAYAGFTGSTGRRWEKHDILGWKWSTIETGSKLE